jgi:hypothetical protein
VRSPSATGAMDGRIDRSRVRETLLYVRNRGKPTSDRLSDSRLTRSSRRSVSARVGGFLVYCAQFA